MTWRIIEEGEIPSLPLGRLKTAFRIQHDHDDDLFRHLTQVAKQYIETYTHTILGDVRLELTLDRWERSKQSWTGVSQQHQAPGLWIPLPVGPMRTLESVSIRSRSGDWTDIPTEHFFISGHRLGIRTHLPHGSSDIHSIQIIGRGGLTPVSSLIEGIWLNLVRCLYDSDTPDMAIVYAALAPLKHLQPLRLI